MGVRYDPGGGSPPAVTSFSDTWIGADRPPYMGNSWLLQMTQTTAVLGSDVAAQMNIGATGLGVGNGGGGNLNNTNLLLFPSLVDRAAVVAKSATVGVFSQMTVVSRPIVGINAAFGPAVLLNPGDSSSYHLQLNSTTTNTPLFRMNGNGTYTNLVVSVFATNPGDVVRLEARIVGGFPQLKSYKNGVLLDTTTDNSGLGPTAGQFGCIWYGTFNGQMVVSNYSGGTL
jgi:hypothetical protein